jgi:hypothetical protein
MFGIGFYTIKDVTVEDLSKYFTMTAKIKNETMILVPCKV